MCPELGTARSCPMQNVSKISGSYIEVPENVDRGIIRWTGRSGRASKVPDQASQAVQLSSVQDVIYACEVTGRYNIIADGDPVR